MSRSEKCELMAKQGLSYVVLKISKKSMPQASLVFVSIV